MTEKTGESIGTTLKNRRMEKGMTLESVSGKLRIQPRFLKALEEERWEELPAKVFLEGFLVKYAEHLGLDAVALRTQLRAWLGGGDQPAFTHPAPVPESVDAPSMGPLQLFLLGVAVLFLLGGGFLFFRRQQPTGVSLEKPLRQVTETDPLLPSTPSAASVVSVESSSAPAATGHTAVLRTDDTVWVRVRLDGVVRYEGLLAAGQLRTWSFESNLNLRAGNISKVRISVDGTSLPESSLQIPGNIEWTPPKMVPTAVALSTSSVVAVAVPVRASTSTEPTSRPRN